MLMAQYLENGWRYRFGSNGPPIGNPKRPIEVRMVTWLMTSRDPERSRAWSRYIWGPLSRKRLEIRTWCQWSTYRKWLPVNQVVTWPMTSRDPERSRSWPKYAYGSVSRKRLEIQILLQRSTYRIWLLGDQMVKWLMTSRNPERSRFNDPKGQDRATYLVSIRLIYQVSTAR